MKFVSYLSFVFLLLINFQQTEAQNAIVKNYKDSNLQGVLLALEKEFDVSISYDVDLVTKVQVNGTFKANNISELISKLLKDTNLEFQYIRETYLIYPRRKEQALPKRVIGVSGFVMDGNSEDKLPYTNILLKGVESKYCTSNLGGHYSSHIEIKDSLKIQYSYLGYTPRDTVVFVDSDKIVLNVNLQPYHHTLKDVTITHKREILKLSKKAGVNYVNPQSFNSFSQLGEVDLLRSLKWIPGISGTDESSAGLIIRGNPQYYSRVVLDGINIYHLDHFFGIFSTINSNVIKGVRVHKGGYDVRFGNVAAGIIEVQQKTGKGSKPSVSAEMSMLSSNILAEIPIGKKLSVMVGGRRSYTDKYQSAVYNKFLDNLVDTEESSASKIGGRIWYYDNESKPSFRFSDLNTKVLFTPNAFNEISFTYFQGDDYLDMDDDYAKDDNSFLYESTYDTHWGNKAWALNMKHQWNTKAFSHLIVSKSKYRNKYEAKYFYEWDDIFGHDVVKYSILENNDVEDVSVQLNNQIISSRLGETNFGLAYNKIFLNYNNFYRKTEPYVYDYELDVLNLDGKIIAAYVNQDVKIGSKLNVTGGIRVSKFDLTDKFYWEPRFSINYNLHKSHSLKMSTGIYKQFVTQSVLNNLFDQPLEFWVLANNEDIPVISSHHTMLGYQHTNRLFQFDVEFYHNRLSKVSEYYAPPIYYNDASKLSKGKHYTGDGYSYGADVLLKFDRSFYSGWLAYSWNEVEYKMDGLNSNKYYHPLHDQRHEFKTVNVFHWKNWEASISWIYASGRPYAYPEEDFILPTDGESTSPKTTVFIGEEKNGQRLKAYHRMDLGTAYHFNIGKSKITVGLSIFNVYNRENIKNKHYRKLLPSDKNLPYSVYDSRDLKMLDITPNFFLRLKF